MLDPLHAKLPGRFPPLYEQLVLTYRWADVDLVSYRLLGNPIGPNLSGLLDKMLKDKFLSTCLLKSGYIPFGKGPDIDDPVCFDLKSRKKNREFSIVKLPHEEILCNERIKVVAELAPTFEQLLRTTIEAANRTQTVLSLKNYLRQRLSRCVGDAQRDVSHAELLRYFPCFTAKLQRRPSARFPHHFQIHPSHAASPARS
jgi:hypothetical protein